MQEIENIFLDTVDSTHIWAKKHLQQFDKNKITVISALEQTSGRGRTADKKWISPKGKNIYVSFYFHLPNIRPHLVESLSLFSALVVCFVLEKYSFKPQISWPNDILLSHKKVAGVLAEAIFTGKHADILVGIGLDVNMDAKDLSSIDQPCTSLLLESKKIWDLQEILKTLQNEFAKNLEILEEKGFSHFLPLFQKRLAFLGETVEFADGPLSYKGKINSLTPEGGLNLLTEKGESKTFYSGNIFPIKK